MKIKGIPDNSRIMEIRGFKKNFFGADRGWKVETLLREDPPSGRRKSHEFEISLSLAPGLARRRLLNETGDGDTKPKGYARQIKISDTRTWQSSQIKTCPIPAVRRGGDATQWCFVFDHDGTRCYLPQLELARCLFFHSGYLARRAFMNDGLREEFHVVGGGEEGKPAIWMMPDCACPAGYRKNTTSLNHLAWLLLDGEARRSFESIASHQLTEGEDKPPVRVFDFQFDPPPMRGASLRVRGHYQREPPAFFVYEIHSIRDLTSSLPGEVDFHDPGFRVRRPDSGSVNPRRSPPAGDPEIDQDESPKIDVRDVQLAPQVPGIVFSRPFETKRVPLKEGTPRRPVRGESGGGEADGRTLPVATGESDISGTTLSADFPGSEDPGGGMEPGPGLDGFALFREVVGELASPRGIAKLWEKTLPLPKVPRCGKHLLANGGQRRLCAALLETRETRIVLVEVDVSDNAARLATLLLREPRPDFNWEKYLPELAEQLVRRSLRWPTDALDRKFRENHSRVPHPAGRPPGPDSGQGDFARRWAERIRRGISSLPAF